MLEREQKFTPLYLAFSGAVWYIGKKNSFIDSIYLWKMKIDRSKLRKTQSDVVSLGENDLPLNFDSETTCMHPLKSSQS